MRRRLSILMFLQYSIPGAWVPIFSLILKQLEFTPYEMASACATSALGALAAPLLWGQIADRWLPAQQCISFCACLSGILLWVLAELTTPAGMFIVSLGFWFFMVPAVSLGTSVTFRHLEHPERQFGPVRMWGTVGWVSANWALGAWFADPAICRACLSVLRPAHPVSELADAFRLGGSLAFCLSAYAWTLPNTPPSPPRQPGPSGRWLWSAFEAPLLAGRLFRQRSFLIYCICLMGFYITLPFSTQLTPLLLEEIGAERKWLPALLTIAQSLEVVTLALLPIILLRLEVKGTLLVGILAWSGALCVLTIARPYELVVASLGLHGVFITCFLVAGQVFVNRRAQADIRTSAQALLQFINGVGLLLGHISVGVIRSFSEGRFFPAFAVATVLSAVLVVVFIAGFRSKSD